MLLHRHASKSSHSDEQTLPVHFRYSTPEVVLMHKAGCAALSRPTVFHP
jgi:hypothetical protein